MKIILDTDIGDDVDDAFALLLALNTPRLEILGVTTVYRNAPLRAKIAASLIRAAGKTVPVYAGASYPLKQDILRFDYEKIGADGLPIIRQYYDYMSDERVETQPAAEFIRECADEYPGEVTLVSIGPLTNAATALDRYPESFAKLGRLMIMGGELAAKQAEWNLRLDAFAAAKVLSANVPITLVPLEATRSCVIDETAMRELDGITSPGMAALRPLMTAWKENFGKNLKCTMHDPLAVSLLTENFCDKQTRRLRVKTDGEKPGLLEETAAGAEITCAANTDAKAFMRYFIDRLKGDEAC